MKRFNEYLSEGPKIGFGIGDFVKLHGSESKKHGHEYGQVHGLNYGGDKDHNSSVSVKLKRSPMHTGDYAHTVKVPMSKLKNLSNDVQAHQAEMGNHKYKERGFKHGDKVKVFGAGRGKSGTILAHNLVTGRTAVKHDDGSTVHYSPTDVMHDKGK